MTPKVSVGPAARLAPPAPDTPTGAEIRARLAALPPLPADWRPRDPHQQMLYRKLAKRATP